MPTSLPRLSRAPRPRAGRATRRFAASVAALALVAGLAACAPASATGEGACVEASVPLADLTIAPDPRAVEGGTTACLPSDAIAPVDDNAEPQLPVDLVDSEGTAVRVESVERILAVDISGTIAATVWGLGLGDRLVGRDSSTAFEGTTELPVVTSAGHTLNAEAILQLAPTVILTDTTIGPKEVRQQLRDAGIPVVVLSRDRRADNVDEIVAEVAEALGVPSRGDALAARTDAGIADATAEIAAVAETRPRPRMLFLYVRGSANVYYLFGEGSGADSLIEAVGGVDVATEIGWEGMRPMTAEALVAAEPDIVVMMTDGLASVGGIDGLLERVPALAQTPAGAHRRVVDMADSAILSFGPRTPEVIRALGRAVWAPEGS